MKTKSTVVQDAYKDYCFFCGTPVKNREHHLIFGRNRKLAEEDGLKVPACDSCHVLGELLKRIHDNPMAEKLSKMLGQAFFERNECAKGATIDEAREKFRKRYGDSFW